MIYESVAFRKGFKDTIPIFIGYFAVAITVGVRASEIGLSPFQASLMSLTNMTSAGQAAALDIMSEGGSWLEVLFSQLVINLRYLLMGAAISFRLNEKTSFGERFLLSFGITDEVFGLSSFQPRPLNPWYTIGSWMMALPGWVLGTLLGAVAGSVLPDSIVSALSIGLYAMFIAIIIPASKKHYFIAIIVTFSMAVSFLVYRYIPGLSSGLRIIILTVVISMLAAIIKPLKEENNNV